MVHVTEPGEPQEPGIRDQYVGPNIKNFLNKKIIIIDRIKYYNCQNGLRKIIEDPQKQLELMKDAHEVGHEGSFKTYHRLK